MTDNFLTDLKSRIEKVDSHLRGGTAHAPGSPFSVNERRILEDGSSRTTEVFQNYRDFLEGKKTTKVNHFARIELKKNSPFSYSIQKPAGYYESVKRSIPAMISRTLFLINQYKYTYARYKNAGSRQEQIQVGRYLNVWKGYIQDYVNFMSNTFGHLIGLKRFNFSKPEEAKTLYFVLVALYTEGYGRNDLRDVLPTMNSEDDQKLYDTLAENVPMLYTPSKNLAEDLILSNSFLEKLLDKINSSSEDTNLFSFVEEEKEELEFVFTRYIKNAHIPKPGKEAEKEEWANYYKRLKLIMDQLRVFLTQTFPNIMASMEQKIAAPLYAINVPLSLEEDVTLPSDPSLKKALSLTDSAGETIILQDEDIPVKVQAIATLKNKPLKTTRFLFSYKKSGEYVTDIRTSSGTLRLKNLPEGKYQEEDFELFVFVDGLKTKISPDEYKITFKTYADLMTLTGGDLKSYVKSYNTKHLREAFERTLGQMLEEIKLSEPQIDPKMLERLNLNNLNVGLHEDTIKKYRDLFNVKGEPSLTLFARNRMGIESLTRSVSKVEIIVASDSRPLSDLESNPLYLFGKQLELKAKAALRDLLTKYKEDYLDKLNKQTKQYRNSLENFKKYEQATKDVRIPADKNLRELEERLNSIKAYEAFGLNPPPEELEKSFDDLLSEYNAVLNNDDLDKKASAKKIVTLSAETKRLINEQGITPVFGSIDTDVTLANKLEAYFPIDSAKRQSDLLSEYLESNPGTRKNSSVDVFLVKNGLYELYKGLLTYYNRKPSKPPVQLSEYAEVEGEDFSVGLFLVQSHSLGE